MSPALAKGLRDLLAYEEDDIEDVFCLNFTVTEDVFGETQTKELKANGENIAVTKENRDEYVQLYIDYVLNKSIDRSYTAFHAGFHKVCGGRVLDLFHARELMALVVGTQNYDWEEFEEQADYKVQLIIIRRENSNHELLGFMNFCEEFHYFGAKIHLMNFRCSDL